ncbi:Mfa1 family fimbria major subunit [Segatella copri]|uniref:Mfa1 family fimbria major subunit n=1 Tax=Segatella copri TaxID=165179 RepID=A0AAW4N589_9BACT|nr:Mfa1 family fimbria major subunit [Segatella copri]MBV3388695.1 Mfa1 family fimbria major subunit [Segatella copri]MBV3396497.1 Mfa1 family fimbria major subunit [Segatella copri]MBV3406131.1 Mfa1 family fimbria major subunit [Segatella copri]
MKKMNLLVMSLVSAAALSFTSCSSNDDLAGNAGQEKVDGFYMTLNVQTPKSDGTRTVVNTPTVDATAEESDVTSGTIYLVDATGAIVFQKDITEAEWKAGQKPTQGKDGSTQIKIEVEKVVAGATYKVYFLANATDKKPWENIFTATNKFAKPYDTNNKFAMFNQNDKAVNGNGYTVVFTDDNKKETSAAQIKYDNAVSPIKIERLTARIDEPTSNVAKIVAYSKTDATPAEKKAMEDAVKKVESIKMTGYAISNLSNKSYIMQNWTETTLNIPSGITYYQPKDEFGTATLLKNGEYFTAATAPNTHKDYVFENNNENAATSMYFEYTVKLKDMTGADFEDGTFYRYNNVIYKSFADIYKAYNDVKGLFGGKTAQEMKDLLTAAKNDKDVESKLDEFRKTYKIEVFNCGKTYYKQAIKDQYIGYENAIQRNSIYRLTVNNIFNVGAQVPNGTPDKEGLFYLDVTVSVNPWVLNTQDVDFK